MINEFGERISFKEIRDIANKVRLLSIKKIDTLWYGCGWIDIAKDYKYKALPISRIIEIKKSAKNAENHIKNLLLETPKSEVIRNLDKILKTKKSH